MIRCSTCDAPIRWVRMAGSGKSMPLDDTPSPHGTVAVTEGVGHVLKGVQIVAYNGPLFISHFATCPDHAKWRKEES